MAHEFDRDYWERHWQDVPAFDPNAPTHPTNPYLIHETRHLVPGAALDAGCGNGIESTWLAQAGWQVTAADISPTALARTAARAAEAGVSDRVQVVETDLGAWRPATAFDLVTSLYAHPDMPQLDFYVRIADWVKLGGTLLLVGHLHVHGVTGHDHHPPESASVTAAAIVDRLGTTAWRIETADELERVVTTPQGRDMMLHDVVVRAVRLG